MCFGTSDDEGVNIADTPFSGECIAYWPTGEISGQGTFKDGTTRSRLSAMGEKRKRRC